MTTNIESNNSEAKKQSVEMDLKVAVFDQTSHWREDLASAAGKIFTVYLYDANRAVNACELRPSYELTPLYYITENSLDNNDLIQSEIDSTDLGDPIYYHCEALDNSKNHTVTSVAKEVYSPDPEDIEHNFDWNAFYYEQFEKAIEYQRGNPTYVDISRIGTPEVETKRPSI